MKHFFIIVIPFFFTLNTFAQEKSMTYINNKSSYYGKTNNERLLFESKINEITLNSDNTFVFWSRPALSCFTWRSYKGSWEQKNDTLNFYDKYDINEQDTKLEYILNSNMNFFILEFSTDNNSELLNKDIKIQYVYDFDSKIDDIDMEFRIKSDNTIKIPFKKIPNIKDLASFRIEYLLNGKEKRYAYLTQNRFVNIKKNKIPNHIIIQFIEKPKKETVYRTIKGIINKEILTILTIDKTKTKLLDYTENISFESEYKLKNE